MSDWKDIVSKVAPVLGTALGGPFAGTAVKFLSDTFLTDDDGNAGQSTEERLSQMFTAASPEKLQELKQADNEFKLKMAEIGLKSEELAVRDTESARKMATDTSIWPQYSLAAVFVVGYFALLGALIWVSVAKGVTAFPQAILILVGILSAAIPQILHFYYGSTKGSGEKNNGIFKLTEMMQKKA